MKTIKVYTPLRYPGGKVKIYPYVKELINSNFSEAPIYVEPFAGGAGLALKLLLTGTISEIHINDFDYAIYSFWYSIVNYNARFIKTIEDTVINITTWKKQKEIYENQSDHSIFDIGFATFFLNRTNRSGIMKAGPIGGKLQNGNYKLDSRFNKNRLISLIKEIGMLSKNIHVYNLDAKDFIKIMDEKHPNAFFYLDPPYVTKGPGLYKNSFNEEDHKVLRNAIVNLANKWFVTYDNHELIHELFSKYRIKKFELNYHVHSFKRGDEIAIYSNELLIPLSTNE